MKGESGLRLGRGRLSTAESRDIATSALSCMAADPERLGPFLIQTGLDPGSIRRAAADPGFLPAVLGHVTGDENLLRAVASELGLTPERIDEARRVLSPEGDFEP